MIFLFYSLIPQRSLATPSTAVECCLTEQTRVKIMVTGRGVGETADRARPAQEARDHLLPRDRRYAWRRRSEGRTHRGGFVNCRSGGGGRTRLDRFSCLVGVAGAYLFLACRSHLTVDHAFLARWITDVLL